MRFPRMILDLRDLNCFIMKKILFTFMAMYCFIACDPSTTFHDNEGVWWVKNTTKEPIGIWCGWTYVNPKIEMVEPGDSLCLYRYFCGINVEPRFGHLLASEPDGNQKISFTSSDGSLLKEWFVSDKDEAGNPFFNENNWRKYKTDKWDGFIKQSWVYDFTTEDIDQKVAYVGK